MKLAEDVLKQINDVFPQYKAKTPEDFGWKAHHEDKFGKSYSHPDHPDHVIRKDIRGNVWRHTSTPSIKDTVNDGFGNDSLSTHLKKFHKEI